ncbi:hypothetical protein A2U01_0034968, partial [Trifolium medium]|nr:hypothetical protein [Trifolium medium]
GQFSAPDIVGALRVVAPAVPDIVGALHVVVVTFESTNLLQG